MNFFKFKDYARSWSVWAMSAISAFATIDFSTTWLDGVVPEEHKPLVYGVLGVIGLFVRSIKQTKE